MTSVPQLAALLKECSLMVTGDTGPMHISVAVGTPVVAMFLASAFGFETGPYSEGNLILQPVIACGPCNPNKPCARPDCHDTIEPETLASIVALRLGEDIRSLPPGLVDPQKVIVYRSYFDQYGFCDLQSLNDSTFDGMRVYRDAYRRVWLDDLAGYIMPDSGAKNQPSGKSSGLSLVDPALSGLDEVAQCATQGCILIEELMAAIRDVRAAPARLGQLNSDLGELDRRIEQIGFHHPALGPLTRMFIFAKENMSGSDAPDLASQMGRIYGDLERRSQKLGKYYRQVRAEHL
jgi:hypothetical protein